MSIARDRIATVVHVPRALSKAVWKMDREFLSFLLAFLYNKVTHEFHRAVPQQFYSIATPPKPEQYLNDGSPFPAHTQDALHTGTPNIIPGQPLLESLARVLGLLRGRFHPAEPVRNAVHVSVDSDPFHHIPGRFHNKISHLGPDTCTLEETYFHYGILQLATAFCVSISFCKMADLTW